MKSRENSADLISNVVLAEIFDLKARTHTQKIKRSPGNLIILRYLIKLDLTNNKIANIIQLHHNNKNEQIEFRRRLK